MRQRHEQAQALDARGGLGAPDDEAPLAVWAFGHEGQGLSQEVLARCALTVRIPQPGGEESLNVAAAAAVCLYEALRRRA